VSDGAGWPCLSSREGVGLVVACGRYGCGR